MKLQIDRMIAKFFSSMPVDEQLNFSVAVTVMSVQRKWRQRMKAHKVCSLAMSAVLCQSMLHTASQPQRGGCECIPLKHSKFIARMDNICVR